MAERYTVRKETLEAIADAVRNKNHSTSQMTPAEIKTAIDNLNVEEDYEWRKPADWPDLESIQLPGSWEESTLYFLYDKKCGIDEVSIYCNSTDRRIYKGNVIDGEFVGELVLDKGRPYTFTDALEDEYTVYKVVIYATSGCRFDKGVTRSYGWADQGCVWIYGEVPTFNYIGGDPTCSLLTPYMRRMYFIHAKDMWFTFPTNRFTQGTGYDISVSYVCGNEEPNDWGSLPVSRTGNGPITPPIKQKSDFVLKNVNFQNSYDKACITARNVVLVNPSGTLKRSQYQNSYQIEKFVVQGGTMKCSSMYYMFTNCSSLVTCDMHDVDFSEMTQSSSAFAMCHKLKNLRLNSTWAADLALEDCAELSRESILGIINDLPVVETAKKLTLSVYAKFNANITDEELAIATNKGWKVA